MKAEITNLFRTKKITLSHKECLQLAKERKEEEAYFIRGLRDVLPKAFLAMLISCAMLLGFSYLYNLIA